MCQDVIERVSIPLTRASKPLAGRLRRFMFIPIGGGIGIGIGIVPPLAIAETLIGSFSM